MSRSRPPRRSAIAPSRFEGLEALEPRLVMAVLHWTGAGDGVTLNDQHNWEHDHLPTINDTAVVDLPGSHQVRMTGGAFTVKKMLLAEQLTLEGGTINVGSDGTDVTGVMNVQGGVFTGAGRLRVQGLLNWTGGRFDGTGDLDVGADGHMVIKGDAALQLKRDISSRGRIDWNGGNIDGLDEGGTFIINEPEGLFRAAGEGRFRSLTTPGLFENRGTFVRAGAGHSQIVVTSVNSGTINVAGGRLELFAGGANRGVRNVAQGARLHYFGDFTHSAGSTLAGGGETIWQGGAHTIDGAWSMASYLYLSNATVNGPALWTITGVVGWSHGRMEGPGGALIAPTGKIEIRTFGQHTLARNIENDGTLIWNRGELAFEGATITNNPGRMFYIAADATAVNAAGDNLVANHGEIRKVLPTLAGLGGVTLDNDGFMNVRNGSLTLGPVAQIAGGTLAGGTWSVYGTATLDLGGAVIDTVGAAASIERIGQFSTFTGLDNLGRNDGRITLSGAATLAVAPAGGEFLNTGTISLRTASFFDVHGAFVQTAGGRIQLGAPGIHPHGAGRIVAESATLDGSLLITRDLTGQQGRLVLFLAAPLIQGQFTLVEFDNGLPGEVVEDAAGLLVMYP
jgi:hypothetical protein